MCVYIYIVLVTKVISVLVLIGVHDCCTFTSMPRLGLLWSTWDFHPFGAPHSHSLFGIEQSLVMKKCHTII